MTLQFESKRLVYDPLNPPKGENSSQSADGRLGGVTFTNRMLEFITIPFSNGQRRMASLFPTAVAPIC